MFDKMQAHSGHSSEVTGIIRLALRLAFRQIELSPGQSCFPSIPVGCPSPMLPVRPEQINVQPLIPAFREGAPCGASPKVGARFCPLRLSVPLRKTLGTQKFPPTTPLPARTAPIRPAQGLCTSNRWNMQHLHDRCELSLSHDLFTTSADKREGANSFPKAG